MGRSAHRVVLPDGMVYVAEVVINNELTTPFVCVDMIEAESRINQILVALTDRGTPVRVDSRISRVPVVAIPIAPDYQQLSDSHGQP